MALVSPTISADHLERAYQYCETMAKTHYENFPVASLILPRAIRRPIAVIYAFARQADDIADEGHLITTKRLQQLQHYRDILQGLASQSPPPSYELVFVALQDVLIKHPKLPISLLLDLLSAFQQDVTKTEYANFEEVLDYCKRSANPIGRLLLILTHNTSLENFYHSDNICTALQLINFLQDLSSDLTERNRCYIPKDEMQQFQVNLEDLKLKKNTPNAQALIQFQLKRAYSLLQDGTILGKKLTGLFGFEIYLIIASGKIILNELFKRKSIYQRPTLTKWHCFKLICLTIFKR